MRLHQVRDAVRDHARLAAAGAGQQQQRTFDVRDGGLLLRIETLEEIHENCGGSDIAILACFRWPNIRAYRLILLNLRLLDSTGTGGKACAFRHNPL